MLRSIVFSKKKPKIIFARGLRKDQTPGEKVIWRKIRERRFHGFKFRRQVPIGPYIVDFLCIEKKLIIEIDGDSHYEEGAQEHDKERETYLQKQGFTVLRFGNKQTIQEPDDVLAKLRRVLGLPSD